MDYINYVKQSPMQGMTGLWGGISSNLIGGITYEAGTFTGDRAIVFGSGETAPGTDKKINYYDITSTGNSSEFGSLTQGRLYPKALSNGTRGVCAGGKRHPSPGGASNVMDYVTTSSTGNATDFGNLSPAANQMDGGACNGERGIFAGGNDTAWPPTIYDNIQYITVASTGNTTDFGDLSQQRYNGCAMEDGIYGVFAGGNGPSTSTTNRIDSVNIFTTGNAIDFGNLYASFGRSCGVSNLTRGVIVGGGSGDQRTTMSYITIQTAGNSTDFGDINQGDTTEAAGSTNLTRGCFAGGDDGQTKDDIGYITIDTTGDSTDFGNLSVSRNAICGTSGAASSDEKLKDNITPIEDSISKVSSISGNTFKWNEKSKFEGELDTGVIAQEVEKLGLPGIVEDQESGYKIVHYYKLVPLLIESVKELSSRVEILEQTILDK
jgi:hypothetical protein